jgi:polyisoprenoid-binding protein YceI
MHEIAGFSAATTLDRKAFGMTAYGGSIGQQVSVWLELEGIRDDGDHDPHP